MANQQLYLTEREMVEYCDMLPVTISQVRVASRLIDAFVRGENKFTTNQSTETIRLNRKSIGRLKNSPVVSIDKVYAVGTSVIGAQGEYEIDPSSLDFDESGYVYYRGNTGNRIEMQTLFLGELKALKIEYTWGYEEIPEDVKLACSMIAMNISQLATFTNVQSITTLDARYALSDAGVFTGEIKQLLSRYRL